MPTNPNMVAIQTVTVGSGGAASIAFSSIPQTYTDLKIVISARSSVAGPQERILISFNGSTADFTLRYLGNAAGSAVSYTRADFGDNMVAYMGGGGSTASTFNNCEIYIPNYTSSNNKSLSIDNVMENNSTTVYFGMEAGLWSNTAAITSLTLSAASGTFVQYSTATLYGVTSSAYGAKATGGIITSDANYYYHTFLASGTFTPTSNITADYLVVAGGGGGGKNNGGGGGAGGVRCTVTATGGGGSLESALSLTASTNYTVTVGAGGTGQVSATLGTQGSNSVFSTITSTGGGYGGGYNGSAYVNGGTGGSGGGAAGLNTLTGGSGTTNQGYAGGGSTSGDETGGGGGAGAAGAAGTSSAPGSGGNGVATSITGSSVTYAGGGGGGQRASAGSTGLLGNGGTGGGGSGAIGTTSTGFAGSAGTANTGGGGGGGSRQDGNGANGGSGIVIVRYAK